jgi:hypothetical protein
MIQRHIYETTEDWKQHRRGLFTASQIHRLMAKPKAAEKLSKGAKTYCNEILAQMIAPPEPDYYNSNMERGNEVEPQAVLAYAELKGFDINDKDFIYTSIGGVVFFSDNDLNVGGTPDLILADRICEIKCPLSKTHLEYLLCENETELEDLKPEYYAQMQLNMYLTERKQCDFISYDDRYFDAALRLKVITVQFDENYFATMIDRVRAASDYLKTIKAKVGL